jgi:hypothetical protein
MNPRKEAAMGREKMMDTRGLYRKFEIRRTDGSSEPGGRHEGCTYFVLDIEHDKHAKAALEAYAKDCLEERPMLSKDLLSVVNAMELGMGNSHAATLIARAEGTEKT